MSEQEWGIILSSHGNLVKELLKSAEMIAGPQNNVFTIGLYQQDSLNSMIKKYDDTYKQIKLKNILILTDLDGGTPTNAAVQFALNKESILVFSGFNLPLLLELLTNRNEHFEKLKDRIQKDWQVTVIDEVKKYQKFQNENQEDL